MANRYDIVTGKIPVKSAEEVASDLEKKFRVKQTTKKSTSMALRGPNGFEIFIPVRNIRFHQEEQANGTYEFHLEIPRSAGASLAADISRANPDAAIHRGRFGFERHVVIPRDRVTSSIEEAGPEEESSEQQVPRDRIRTQNPVPLEEAGPEEERPVAVEDISERVYGDAHRMTQDTMETVRRLLTDRL